LSHPDAVLEGFTVRRGVTGVYCGPGAVVRLCVIRENTAYDGGGVYCSGGVVQGCLITGNEATGNDGGGVYCLGGLVQNCTISYNIADEGGGGVRLSGGAIVENSIICFNSTHEDNADLYNQSGVVRYSCSPSLISGEGNITDDPQFTDSYRLQQTSPCVDAGTNLLEIIQDIDGVPRPLDGDNDGVARWDMGAYELIYMAADSDSDGMSDDDELIAGTDPTNAASLFKVSVLSDESTNTVIVWLTVSNRVYGLESTSNLLTGIWTNEPSATNMPGDGSAKFCTNSSVDRAKFYRVKVRKE
jgi:hypothetical protein